MESPNARKLALILTVFAFGISGCNAVTDTGANTPEPEPTRAMPLDEYLGPIWSGSLVEAQQIAYELERDTQELIAQCMHDAGFEFIPFVPEPIELTPVEQERPDDRDWVTQWGYGLLWSPAGSAQALPAVSMPQDDPNYEYVQSLSEAERSAYMIALDGEPLVGVPSENSGEVIITVEERGCRGWARAEANSRTPLAIWNSDELAPLQEAVMMMSQAGWVVSELAAINADWANCMADAGHLGLERPQDARQRISDEMSDAKLQVAIAGGDFATAPELAEYREREIEMALADLDCRDQVDYRNRTSDVAFEMQTQFVNDHRAELEALRVAFEQQ